MKNVDHVVLSIFSHHEYYPPTLHAITNLAGKAKTITVVTRNQIGSNWEFPDNVTVKVSGEKKSLDQSLQLSFIAKVKSFFQYTFLLRRTIVDVEPNLVVLHDPIALLAHWAIARVKKLKYLIWYHNHDVIEPSSMRRYSVMWFAEKYQPQAFKEIDIFTLPTPDRRAFFPKIKDDAVYHTVHNYPSLEIYSKAYNEKQVPVDRIKLLYQGVIRGGHGLEEIISILDQKILGRDFSLTIIGNIPFAYKELLQQLAKDVGVEDQLIFLNRITYRDLPFETCKYDIGLAIHQTQNIQYTTGGLASNKIYEYAALGLPVLYYDTENYNQALGEHDWAFPVTLEKENIKRTLEVIMGTYEKASKAAHKNFSNKNNYEYYFLSLIEKLDH